MNWLYIWFDSINVYPEFRETDITDISIFKCLEFFSILSNFEVSDKKTHKQEKCSDKKIVCKYRYKKQLNQNRPFKIVYNKKHFKNYSTFMRNIH